nr:MAG TPA: hypothetical protein [Caudoviricetes sp.]
MLCDLFWSRWPIGAHRAWVLLERRTGLELCREVSGGLGRPGE